VSEEDRRVSEEDRRVSEEERREGVWGKKGDGLIDNNKNEQKRTKER
jgi:hypothetical protein